MINSQEKAKELVDKFYYALPNNGLQVGVGNVNSRWQEAKKCSIIAVDEILNVLSKTPYYKQETYNYWQEVKQEIEKL